MPLCQFIITPTNSGTDFVVPVSGAANIKVIGVQYVDTNNGNHHHIVQIRSDVLIFPYSPAVYLTFMASAGTHVQTNVNYDTGKNEYSINKCNLQGRIKLEVIDQETGLQPDHFGHCLLTLEIENINVGYSM